MEWFRQISIVRRVAVSVIVLYALLLQGFLVAPAIAFGSLGEITCQQEGSRPETPAGEHHHPGLCCILCAICGSVPVAASSSGIAVFPILKASRVIWHSTLGNIAQPPIKYRFYARGPPQAV
ncbi:MAG: hypothetical protein ACLP4V_22695 [Methylocella sp.]